MAVNKPSNRKVCHAINNKLNPHNGCYVKSSIEGGPVNNEHTKENFKSSGKDIKPFSVCGWGI